MEVSVKLKIFQACLMPAFLYGKKAWKKLSKAEIQHLEKIQGKAFTLTSVGFLGVRFEVGGSKITPTPHPCLKPVRIMLETSNVARRYKPICSFRKYTF